MSTHDEAYVAVVNRLDRLERQNRRMRTGGIVLLLLVGTVLLAAFTEPQQKIVEAEQFVVIDPSGTTRAQFGYYDGSIVLRLKEAGGSAVMLGVRPNGTSVFSMLFRNGDPAFEIGVIPSGEMAGTAMTLYDAAQRGRIGIFLGAQSSSPWGILLLDTDGNLLWSAPN